MRSRVLLTLAALFLTATSAQANTVTFTSQTFQQTADGQRFEFIIDNAPLAALTEGSLWIHARGDYSENSDLENIAFSIDGVAFPDNASPYFGGIVSNSHHQDVVEWSQEFVLDGADLVNWTSDNKIVIWLNLSSDVEFNLHADGFTAQFPPFVKATLTYNTPAVPLPAAAWLFAGGLLGVFGTGKYRKSC
ncbi:VPLPA-CTERM sorting domain-containing protein [Methylomonas sp. EFPC3]|uniref:VPLPA-CTERM sorting domain-containing protein n=1 Tax=Methylomonas sp. EFPC3 TaxID=3021710 RepID=UPI0024174024|nr:VPLPA-CTERM sorting domain-containing protein [Methylomonas sp. EFPC3]WFP49721.1 VPLPA-CTERM sorting domain-containing protein [Methylomonas sp. EFPC3]